ncbi:hypothetical protein DVH26_32735 [Paenibacillus sp. H1-7]|nr:hypothetical protein DVH26_32735 [Paenibacillus sp. H1-7]
MWILAGIALMLGWTLWKEYPALWKGRKIKELILLSAITLVVTALCLAHGLSISLPNPLNWIEAALSAYPAAVYSIFQ